MLAHLKVAFELEHEVRSSYASALLPFKAKRPCGRF